MADIPTVEEIRAWAGVAEADISDEQIEMILGAELDNQLAYATFWPIDYDPDVDGPLPDPLAQAILRRCARAFAARGLPLGSLPAPASGQGAEYGMPRNLILPRLDAEITRYEQPYQIPGVA